MRKAELFTKMDSIRNVYSPICWHMYDLRQCDRCRKIWYGAMHNGLTEGTSLVLCWRCKEGLDVCMDRCGLVAPQKYMDIERKSYLARQFMVSHPVKKPLPLERGYGEYDPEPYYAMVERVIRGERPKSTLPKRLQSQVSDPSLYARVSEEIIEQHIQSYQSVRAS